jgi:putative oxidoreductase
MGAAMHVSRIMQRENIPLEEHMNIYTGFAPALGRWLIALIFLLSGVGKILEPAGTIGYIQSAGLPLPQVAYLITILVELVAGLFLLIGFETRVAALVLALFSIAAALNFHTNFADQNQLIHFMKNLAIAGGLLQVFAFGAGEFSVDARRGKL